MNDIYVFQTVWDCKEAHGYNLYVLYSDNTYEWYHMNIYPCGQQFKKFIKARTMRDKKFNKEQVKKYLDEKMKEWERAH